MIAEASILPLAQTAGTSAMFSSKFEGLMLFVLHLALGGCLSLPPVRYGLTADTGGHIAYVLEAACAQAALPHVAAVSVVTRLFNDARLGVEHAQTSDTLGANVTIDRIATANRAYLEKEALWQDLPQFIEAFCHHLATLPALPDVIHAHFADAAEVAQVCRARFGIPFVYTPHALGIDKRNLRRPCNRLDLRISAERTALATADAVIVSTPNEAVHQVAAYAVPGLAARIWRMPPGVPRHATGAIMVSSWAEGLTDPDKPIVLAIARPVRKKNLVSLVSAFAKSDALRQRANLIILAGQHANALLSGEQRAVVAELQHWAAIPELRGHVALPGRHNAADVAALYLRAASGGVFVNPALHEPFGLTLIEAAAAGVPVVATRRGGPADIVAATGHGLLVDPHDQAAIAASCLRILSDPALHHRLSRAGLNNAHRYSWPRYAEQSVALYASLKRRRPALAAAEPAVAAA